MAIIGQPPTSPVDEVSDSTGKKYISTMNSEWRQFFNSAYTILFSLTQSGTTANRPTKLLWTGRPYFDTTLGKPIWYKTAGWVDATGAAV